MTDQNNALANLGEQVAGTLDKSTFADITKVGDYIPPMRLMQKQSDAVGDETIGAKIGEFLWDIKDRVGKSFNCIPVAYRPHAMRMENRVVKSEVFLVNEEYNKIRADQDAKPKVQGAMQGVDFLLYVPGRSFCIYFLYGTARRAAPDFEKNMKKAITVQSRHVDTKAYSWEVPEVVPCTSELTVDCTEDEAKAVVAKFLNAVPLAPGTQVDESGRPR